MEKKRIELEKRFESAWRKLQYAGDATYHNTFAMLFWWWIENGPDTEENMLNKLTRGNDIDFLDFISASSVVINFINRGKTEFDFDNIKHLSKEYDLIDGILIQTHSKLFREYSLDLIDYIFACLNFTNGFATGFSKYEEQ